MNKVLLKKKIVKGYWFGLEKEEEKKKKKKKDTCVSCGWSCVLELWESWEFWLFWEVDPKIKLGVEFEVGERWGLCDCFYKSSMKEC